MRTRYSAVSSQLSALSSSRVHAIRLTVFGRYLLYTLCSLLFALCSLTVHSAAAEISAGTEQGLTRVIIRKQSGLTLKIPGSPVEKTFLVEVVSSVHDLNRGLAHREGMQEDHGMLFVLDTSKEHVFWMKGMRFPLDIIFIGRDMQITEILHNLQPCEECPLYFPKKQRPAYALEINAGIARNLGLSVGDTMVIEK